MTALPSLLGDRRRLGFLKAAFHCDGADGSTALTDSQGLCAMTASGNAQIDDAQFRSNGASALVDGTGDYWTDSVNRSALRLDGGQTFSVEVDVRVGALVTQCLLGQRNATTGNGWEVFIASDGSFYIQGTASFVQSAASQIAVGTWYRLRFERAVASGTVRIYLDGVEKASGALTISTESTVIFRVGRRSNPAPSNFDVNGHLDNIHIYAGFPDGQ
jgi:Concanavalin A-like lectin/glucanases superfamily